MGSIVKFANRCAASTGSELHWGRAAEDGAPFRGPIVMYKNDEYDRKVVRVADAHVEVFDIGDPEQKLAYQTILDRAASGWYQILTRDCKWVDDERGTRMFVYVEWVENYYEDGAPAGYRMTNS